jgi:hypothetical protein
VICSVEITFTHNGIYNTRNLRRWSNDKQHGTVEANFQLHFSIRMWYGMINYMLIGPIILDDHMTEHNYLDSLQNGLPEQLEDVPLTKWIAIYLQHD